MAGGSRTVTLNVVGDSSRAETTLDRVAGKSESSSGRMGKAFSGMGSVLNGVTQGAFGPFAEGIEKARGAMESMGEGGDRLGAKAMKWGAGITAAGAAFTAWGDKDKAALQVLNQAIDNTGKAHEDYAEEVEKAVKGQERFGFTAVETQNALAKLTLATNDPAKAMELLDAAAGRARVSHKSLEMAATDLGRAYNGSTKIMKELGVEAGPKAVQAQKALESSTKAVTTAEDQAAKAKQALADVEAKAHAARTTSVGSSIALRNAQEAVKSSADKVAQAHKNVTAAEEANTKAGNSQADNMDKIKAKYQDVAKAGADTLSGRLRSLKAEVEDGAAKLGQKYGPAVTGAGVTMMGLGAAVETGSKLLNKFKPAQEAMTAATEAGTAATEAATVAETESAVAETAALWPILLIIGAVALLGLGIYELWTHWKQIWGFIKDKVKDTVEAVTGFISGSIDWIKEHWPLILAILTGPFGLAVLFVKDHFGQIVEFLKGIPKDIENIAKGIGRALANPVIDAINAIIGAWDSIHFGVPELNLGPLGHVGGGDFRVPQIPKVPRFAEGGIVTGLTLALLGDNPSGVEAVVPKERAAEFGFGGGDGGGVAHVTLVVDGRAIAKAITPYTREETNRMAPNSPTLNVA